MKAFIRAQVFLGTYFSASSNPISAPAHNPTKTPSMARISSSGT